MEIQKNEYEYRLVAWLDILGFAEFIKDENNYSPVRELIDDLLRNTHEGVEENEPIKTGPPGGVMGYHGATRYKFYPRTTVISDTIVMSFEFEMGFITIGSTDQTATDNFFKLQTLINYVSKLQYKILFHPSFSKYNLAIRGAISIGKAIHEKFHAFGPVIAELHELEKCCAIYPRVIFSEDLKNAIDPRCNGALNIQEDKDGEYYINFLQEIGGKEKEKESKLFQLAEKKQKEAQEKFEKFNTSKKTKKAQKWKWLEGYFLNYINFILWKKDKENLEKPSFKIDLS